jgi:uncharacterized low-complexity protein
MFFALSVEEKRSKMNYKKMLPVVALTLGVTVQLAANAEIFKMSEVSAQGSQLAAAESKCGAGSCGAAKTGEHKCGATAKTDEHKCGAAKADGHKCTGKKHDKKDAAAKCAAAKCAAKKN